ncbi:hypothetical protein C2845_PM17G06270 [Panicum miliaceum]|uniref:Uncharacterized protein n=1 Tax=Panicum miliaceum TaxID=4540 RepID=A0A3L6Q5U9_PANMI|nr:hypothetical protein C2845_PM17G06270 [Panicum miliaceum]
MIWLAQRDDLPPPALFAHLAQQIPIAVGMILSRSHRFLLVALSLISRRHDRPHGDGTRGLLAHALHGEKGVRRWHS